MIEDLKHLEVRGEGQFEAYGSWIPHAPDDAARIRIEAARHVQREHGTGQRQRAFDELARASRERAREADAEQAVDDEAAAVFSVDVGHEARAAGLGPFERALRLRRRRGAREVHDVDIGAEIREVRRDLQCVAAVVAGAGQHEDAPRRQAAQHFERIRGCGLAGASHEHARRELRLRGLFDGADLRDAVERIVHGGSRHVTVAKTALSPKSAPRATTIAAR